jgi:hypothetical protein
MIRDPQIWEIQEHRKHEQQRESGYRVDARAEESTDGQPEPTGTGAYQNGTATT